MNRSDYGSKHLCQDCETKYYDLKKTVVLCPKCGAKPVPQTLLRSAPRVRKPSASPFRRSH